MCEDGSKKMNVFMAPCVVHKLEMNAPASEFANLSLAMAGWIRYLCGKDEAGEAIVYEDNMA